MIKIILPKKISDKLVAALKEAGDREIGGILMGEHLAENVFRIMDITVQRKGGSFASFIRVIQGMLGPIKRFFQLTGHNYKRFNYLGEWHSHPAFSLAPSCRDQKTMCEIVEDPLVGANFAVLMIVKLETDQLQGTVTIFMPGRRMFKGDLIREELTG